jgi:hypothetical protein
VIDRLAAFAVTAIICALALILFAVFGMLAYAFIQTVLGACSWV